jgi:uncharacterized membrane protein YjjB (DUF3815 family)
MGVSGITISGIKVANQCPTGLLSFLYSLKAKIPMQVVKIPAIIPYITPRR